MLTGQAIPLVAMPMDPAMSMVATPMVEVAPRMKVPMMKFNQTILRRTMRLTTSTTTMVCSTSRNLNSMMKLMKRRLPKRVRRKMMKMLIERGSSKSSKT
jgi:hypothetical protein